MLRYHILLFKLNRLVSRNKLSGVEEISLAGQLAEQLRHGLRQGGTFYIELHGTLGAGKTTFTRHLLRALGVAGRIKSPSYAVVEPHELPEFDIHHFDFYRFNDPQEWEDAGFRELFAAPGLKIAEWPEKAQRLLPLADLRVDIQAPSAQDGDEEDGTVRQVRMHAQTAPGQDALRMPRAPNDGHQDAANGQADDTTGAVAHG